MFPSPYRGQRRSVRAQRQPRSASALLPPINIELGGSLWAAPIGKKLSTLIYVGTLGGGRYGASNDRPGSPSAGRVYASASILTDPAASDWRPLMASPGDS